MIRFLAILAAALIVPAVLPATASQAHAQAAYVHEMSGSVTATLNSQTRALKTGDVIATGTVVSTGDKSHAVIKFEDGQIMALSERSSFRIVEYRYVKERVRDSNAVFALLQGGLRFISGVIGSTNRNSFRLTAGTATIGIRGTDGAVVYDQISQAVSVAVFVGAVVINNAQGTQYLSPGQIYGLATAVVQQVFDILRAFGMPLNYPISIAASAAAAVAVAKAAQTGNPADAAEAQRLLDIAIADAQAAYQQALDGGGAPPDSTTTTPGGGTPINVPGAGGSVSPS